MTIDPQLEQLAEEVRRLACDGLQRLGFAAEQADELAEQCAVALLNIVGEATDNPPALAE